MSLKQMRNVGIRGQLGNAAEMRGSKRYLLKAAAAFSWKTAEGKRRSGKGWTLDISYTGVFVASKARLPAGALLDFRVRLPSLPGSSNPVLLHGVGVVLRIAHDNLTQIGFAAEILFDPDASDRILSRSNLVH